MPEKVVPEKNFIFVNIKSLITVLILTLLSLLLIIFVRELILRKKYLDTKPEIRPGKQYKKRRKKYRK